MKTLKQRLIEYIQHTDFIRPDEIEKIVKEWLQEQQKYLIYEKYPHFGTEAITELIEELEK